MKNEERGFFLPITVGVITLLFLVFSVLIEQLHRFHYAEKVEWARMEAKYAASSGIELMKQRLAQQPANHAPLHLQWDQIKVQVTIKPSKHKRQPTYQLRAIAYAMMGVKQTVTLHIEPQQKE